MSRRRETRKGGCLRCGTTESASIRNTPTGCSACSNACMEAKSPAPASVWRFAERSSSARADGSGWNRKPGAARPSSLQSPPSHRVRTAARGVKMGDSDQNRMEVEIERTRTALEAETLRCLDVQRQLDRANAEFEEFVS